MNELLIDVSRWQGEFTPATAKALRAANVVGAWVKLTQGGSYKDPVGLANAKVLQDGGLKVGGYHFTNLDRATDQAKNFIDSLSRLTWDLPPMMDTEAFVQASAVGYAGTTQEEYSLRELQNVPGLADEYAYAWATNWETPAIYESKRLKLAIAPDGLTVGLWATYGAQLPRYQDVDVIGMRVTTWMETQPRIAHFKYPPIYTNPAYGNKIYPVQAAKNMARYPLMIAHWGVSVPTMPALWKGREYISWQYKVDTANESPIGQPLDRQRWGKLFTFPADPEPEPDPDPDPGKRTVYVVMREEDGARWAGDLEEVTQ